MDERNCRGEQQPHGTVGSGDDHGGGEKAVTTAETNEFHRGSIGCGHDDGHDSHNIDCLSAYSRAAVRRHEEEILALTGNNDDDDLATEDDSPSTDQPAADAASDSYANCSDDHNRIQNAHVSTASLPATSASQSRSASIQHDVIGGGGNCDGGDGDALPPAEAHSCRDQSDVLLDDQIKQRENEARKQSWEACQHDSLQTMLPQPSWGLRTSTILNLVGNSSFGENLSAQDCSTMKMQECEDGDHGQAQDEKCHRRSDESSCSTIACDRKCDCDDDSRNTSSAKMKYSNSQKDGRAHCELWQLQRKPQNDEDSLLHQEHDGLTAASSMLHRDDYQARQPTLSAGADDASRLTQNSCCEKSSSKAHVPAQSRKHRNPHRGGCSKNPLSQSATCTGIRDGAQARTDLDKTTNMVLEKQWVVNGTHHGRAGRMQPALLRGQLKGSSKTGEKAYTPYGLEHHTMTESSPCASAAGAGKAPSQRAPPLDLVASSIHMDSAAQIPSLDRARAGLQHQSQPGAIRVPGIGRLEHSSDDSDHGQHQQSGSISASEDYCTELLSLHSSGSLHDDNGIAHSVGINRGIGMTEAGATTPGSVRAAAPILEAVLVASEDKDGERQRDLAEREQQLRQRELELEQRMQELQLFAQTQHPQRPSLPNSQGTATAAAADDRNVSRDDAMISITCAKGYTADDATASSSDGALPQATYTQGETHSANTRRNVLPELVPATVQNSGIRNESKAQRTKSNGFRAFLFGKSLEGDKKPFPGGKGKANKPKPKNVRSKTSSSTSIASSIGGGGDRVSIPQKSKSTEEIIQEYALHGKKMSQEAAAPSSLSAPTHGHSETNPGWKTRSRPSFVSSRSSNVSEASTWTSDHERSDDGKTTQPPHGLSPRRTRRSHTSLAKLSYLTVIPNLENVPSVVPAEIRLGDDVGFGGHSTATHSTSIIEKSESRYGQLLRLDGLDVNPEVTKRSTDAFEQLNHLARSAVLVVAEQPSDSDQKGKGKKKSLFRFKSSNQTRNNRYAYNVKRIRRDLYNKETDSKFLRYALLQLQSEACMLTNLHSHPNIKTVYAMTDLMVTDALTGKSVNNKDFQFVVDAQDCTLGQYLGSHWKISHERLQKKLTSLPTVSSSNKRVAQARSAEFELQQLDLERLGVAVQIASALDHLHCHNIIFGNLSPDSIGISITDRIRMQYRQRTSSEDSRQYQANVKLWDFEFGMRILNDDGGPGNHPYNMNASTNSIPSTVRKKLSPYTAPEMILESVMTLQVDTYAFGMLLWEMLYLKVPFADVLIPEFVTRVLENGYRPKLRSSSSSSNALSRPPDDMRLAEDPRVSQLMQECWSRFARDRPCMFDVHTKLLQLLERFEVRLNSGHLSGDLN